MSSFRLTREAYIKFEPLWKYINKTHNRPATTAAKKKLDRELQMTCNREGYMLIFLAIRELHNRKIFIPKQKFLDYFYRSRRPCPCRTIIHIFLDAIQNESDFDRVMNNMWIDGFIERSINWSKPFPTEIRQIITHLGLPYQIRTRRERLFCLNYGLIKIFLFVFCFPSPKFTKRNCLRSCLHLVKWWTWSLN